jgi:uncharacterized protein YkwD
MSVHVRGCTAAALAVVMLGGLWLGCGAPAEDPQGPRQVGQQPSWRKPSEVQGYAAGSPTVVPGLPRAIVFSPPGPSATHYNAGPAAPVPRSPLSDAILGAINETCLEMRCKPPVADSRLFAAIGELAQVVPEDGPLAYPLVEFALQRHGIIEPSPHLVIIWGPLDDPAPMLEQLRPRLPSILSSAPSARPFSRVAVGTSLRNGDEGVAILALQSSHIETQPIPRALPRGGAMAIEGTIKDGYRKPEVFVTRENGKVEHVAEGQGVRFHARVSCDGRRGKQQVEVTAVDAAGSTVLANFPVWCNEEPPASITVEPDEDDTRPVKDGPDAETRMLALVNRDRAAHSLPPLAQAGDVAAVARAHSLEMRETGVVAHVSPMTGSAADRVRAAGIRTPVVLENIARAYGVAEAQSGLMNSPGHRANILSPEATHLGVGIVLGEEVAGRRELFVTQVFTRVPPKVSTADALRQLHARMGQRKVGEDQGLSGLAQEYADALMTSEPAAAISGRLSKKLDGFAPRYRKVTTSVIAVADVEAFDAQQHVGDAAVSHYGMGLARGAHAELGDNALFIVLLLAVAR